MICSRYKPSFSVKKTGNDQIRAASFTSDGKQVIAIADHILFV